jgi:hypothetical protein
MDAPSKPLFTLMTLMRRTVARGPKQAGNHCQKVHEERVMQKHLDVQHVQADAHPGQSLRVLIPWIAMALQIKTRLWLGGVVSEHRASASLRCLVPSG